MLSRFDHPVTRGLDPRAHLFASLFPKRRMDHRAKPGNEAQW
jgi:hypothetical protein